MDQVYELFSEIKKTKTNLKRDPNRSYTKTFIDNELNEIHEK